MTSWMTFRANHIRASRIALTVVSIVLMFAASVAGLLGATMTCCALTPGTDMGDANVLIRFGPAYALGGLLGVLLARRLWRVVATTALTTDALIGSRVRIQYD